jgi:hypothetical protein
MTDFMAAPCKHCPFKRDVKPFLHPHRAYDIATNAENRYGSFPCHKTTEEDDSEWADGEMMVVETTKECAGHLYMHSVANGSTFYDEEGFEPKAEWNCYEDSWEMQDAYLDAWIAAGHRDPDDEPEDDDDE